MQYQTKKKLTIMIIAFLQGLGDMNILTMFYYYKELLLLPVITLQVVQCCMIMPWIFKPVFGYLTDNFPIFGYRRKSYLLIIVLFEAAFYFYLATMPMQLPVVLFLNMVTVICIVFKNILAEGMVVELTHEVQKKSLATKKFIASKGSSNQRASVKSSSFTRMPKPSNPRPKPRVSVVTPLKASIEGTLKWMGQK